MLLSIPASLLSLVPSIEQALGSGRPRAHLGVEVLQCVCQIAYFRASYSPETYRRCVLLNLVAWDFRSSHQIDLRLRHGYC
jgi:hypothetical protein